MEKHLGRSSLVSVRLGADLVSGIPLQWRLTSRIDTREFVPRTRSKVAYQDVFESAPKHNRKISGSLQQIRVGMSTLRVMVALNLDTLHSSCATCRRARQSVSLTDFSCSTFVPRIDSHEPQGGSKLWMVGLSTSRR